MNPNEITQLLIEKSFLRGIDLKDLGRIVEISRSAEYSEGDLIFREGDAAKDLYVILSGIVSLEFCAAGVGCRQLMTLTIGDLLSWSSVLNRAKMTVTARAITPVQVLAIDGRQLLTACEHDAMFGFQFMQRVAEVMGQRLTAARMQLIDVYGGHMSQAPPPQSQS